MTRRQAGLVTGSLAGLVGSCSSCDRGQDGLVTGRQGGLVRKEASWSLTGRSDGLVTLVNRSCDEKASWSCDQEAC